jgi:Transposase, Mutator family
MLTTAIEAEVAQWLEGHEHLRDELGHRQVVRNGYLPERSITTGIGPYPPAARSRSPPGRGSGGFSSKILPPYLRETRSIEELLPWLYLKGISTGDFNEALQALVGPECPDLSASTVARLLESWQAEYHEWSKRSLKDKHYAYLWVDCVHFNIRLEEDRQCILVLLGPTPRVKPSWQKSSQFMSSVTGLATPKPLLRSSTFRRPTNTSPGPLKKRIKKRSSQRRKAGNLAGRGGKGNAKTPRVLLILGINEM